MDHQGRISGFRSLILERHSRFQGKLGNKSLNTALQCCILGPLDSDGEGWLNMESARPQLHHGWQRHKVELWLLLRRCSRYKQNCCTGDKEFSHSFLKNATASRKSVSSTRQRGCHSRYCFPLYGVRVNLLRSWMLSEAPPTRIVNSPGPALQSFF